MRYLCINDRYAGEACPVESWDEFVRMCQECFGEDFVEPDYQERSNGDIYTQHGNSWELTLQAGRDTSEWAKWLEERFRGTEYETTNPADYYGWCAAGVEPHDDEEHVAAAWIEGCATE